MVNALVMDADLVEDGCNKSVVSFSANQAHSMRAGHVGDRHGIRESIEKVECKYSLHSLFHRRMSVDFRTPK